MKKFILTAFCICLTFVFALAFITKYVPRNTSDYISPEKKTKDFEEAILSEQPERHADIAKAYEKIVSGENLKISFEGAYSQITTYENPVENYEGGFLVEGFVLSPVYDKSLARKLWQVEVTEGDNSLVFKGGQIDIAFLKCNNYMKDINKIEIGDFAIRISYALKITYPAGCNIEII